MRSTKAIAIKMCRILELLDNFRDKNPFWESMRREIHILVKYIWLISLTYYIKTSRSDKQIYLFPPHLLRFFVSLQPLWY